MLLEIVSENEASSQLTFSTNEIWMMIIILIMVLILAAIGNKMTYLEESIKDLKTKVSALEKGNKVNKTKTPTTIDINEKALTKGPIDVNKPHIDPTTLMPREQKISKVVDPRTKTFYVPGDRQSIKPKKDGDKNG